MRPDISSNSVERMEAMFRMEFHAAEGGADAEAFAQELAASVARYSGLVPVESGRVVSLVAEHRL